jgi:hypothetical protein
VTESPQSTEVGFAQFLAGIGPWLMELGNWIFGGLIAFNLVILGAVLTIEPLDVAVKIAIAADALALPPSAVGLILLRLVADVRSLRQSQPARQAFRDVGFNFDGLPVSEREAALRRLDTVIFRVTNGLMAVTILLTLVGLTAALWHGAWWIGVAFLGVLALSLGGLVLGAAQLARGGARWRSAGGESEARRS